MRVTQRRPVYLQTGAPGELETRYLIDLPWTTTSGSGPFRYNNLAHAALHSLLAALKCGKIADARSWILESKRQLDLAAEYVMEKSARVPDEPRRNSRPGEIRIIQVREIPTRYGRPDPAIVDDSPRLARRRKGGGR